jgi:DNA-directed RNA polymerase specialized sigma24 family protein
MVSGWRIADLAQEGWIEMWRRSQNLKPGYPIDLQLKMAATDRMRTVLRNWRSVKNQPGLSLDGLLEDRLQDDILTELGLTDHLLGVELAYHHGEIYAALNDLSPREREYVVLRFWCGYRLPQMRAHFGYEPSALWRTARVKLQEALGSLQTI